MSSYAEKLKDPRWQKKRLETMKRDDFTCLECQDTETTLNVHHLYYEKNKDPWDYPLSSLMTLCEECHKSQREFEEEIKKLNFNSFKRCGFSSSIIVQILPTFHDLKNCPYNIFVIWDLLVEVIAGISSGRTSPQDLAKLITSTKTKK